MVAPYPTAARDPSQNKNPATVSVAGFFYVRDARYFARGMDAGSKDAQN